jgi:hypothetical protein
MAQLTAKIPNNGIEGDGIEGDNKGPPMLCDLQYDSNSGEGDRPSHKGINVAIGYLGEIHVSPCLPIY